uniref:NADH-ubiquinone oxidoreductase chain 4L n=1 Tax=Anolis punctatus TaxID=174263 RepID=A0A513X1B0_ANOPN|nr:NADH dehydrogenase subunit 4L [Anolis punctatus]QDH07721.1 NADH dehydrogenase subunit 4L [Anolis punctatus]
MTPILLMIFMTFSLSIMGLSIQRMHLMSALLCIEGAMLALFIATTLLFSTTQTPTWSTIPIFILSFSACEASTGLAMLVATSRTHGNDKPHNMNLLQC